MSEYRLKLRNILTYANPLTLTINRKGFAYEKRNCQRNRICDNIVDPNYGRDDVMKEKRKDVTAEDVREYLKDKRILLDCGHHACQHNFSNTMAISPEGKIICSECYQ